jgi:predicted kinase
MNGRVLVQMHGVPGSGKSTLARSLGTEIGAVVVDKDALTTGAIRAGVPISEAGKVAYEAAWLLLPSLLAQGFSVVHDSPCFWPNIEEQGRRIATESGAPYAMVECRCEDLAELDRRLASRERVESNPTARGAGAGRPGMYEPSCERLIVDGTRPLSDLVREAVAYLSREGVVA